MVNQKSFNFNKKSLDAIEAPKDKKYETYCDTVEKGLKLYVTQNGTKTFFIRKFIDFRDERIIIGPYPDLNVTQAREKARVLKGSIACGNNPAEEKRKIRKDMTISEFFDYYMTNYSKVHKKPHSIRSELALFKYHIKDFIGYKKMNMVKKNDIERFLFSYKNKKNNALINRIISLLSGMYNRAIDWGYTEANPVRGIKKEKELSRERFIRPEELPNFFKALEEEPNIQLKNFILLSLYIGQRKSNMLAMRWSQIDFKLGVWFIPMTKNGESLTCPLTDKAIELLKQMKETAISDWVFPSKTSATGHFVEPKKAWKNLLKRAGIEDLRIHDLRRTLGSYQAINGSSLQIIGRSLGHKTIQATQIYARLINEPIRNSTNGAIDRMMSYVGEV